MTMTCRAFRLLLLTTLLEGMALSGSAAAQTPVSQAWAVRIDGPSNTWTHASGMDVGPSGDVFLVANVRGAAYYLNDIEITRRSSSGAVVWERRYEAPGGPSGSESAFGMVVHGTNIFITGSITTTNGPSPDFLTLKYRDTGELEWAARTDGPGQNNDSASDIAVDGDGNVLVLGGSIGTNGTSDIVVLKYDPAGNLLWTYSYDGPEHGADRGVAMRVDASGNTYIAGTSAEWSWASAVVTIKLDADGHELWIARETAAVLYGVTARGLDVDSAGNVVTVGVEWAYSVTWKYDANGNRQWTARYRAEENASMSAVRVRFDGGGDIITAANLYGSGTNDAVVIKYSADGEQLWATRISHPNGVAHLNALDVDFDGNSYIEVSPGSDVVTVKVSPDGIQLWSVTYNSEGFFSDSGEFLEVTPSGDVFVAGRSIHFTEAFVSVVKYTQQPITGVAAAVVTPALQVADPGANVVFTAVTIGPEPIHFQWRKNGRPIPDATGSTLSLSNVQAFHRGDYSVIVSSEAGVTVSPEARLSVRVPPEVVIAPTQTVAYVGGDTAFAATISGNDFATLQWRHNGTNIPGATNEILRLENLNDEAIGSYDIVVSTFGGTATSSAAGLRISRAVELIGNTPHRSSVLSWDYEPQLHVLPNGDFLIAARSNHLMGSSIVLYKHAANGDLLWTTAFESTEFTNAAPSRLVLDGAGNIYISGVSARPSNDRAWAVLKYTSGGQLLWSRILTGTNFWGSIHAFAVDAEGDSTIATLGGSGGTRAMVTRYNHAGDLQWSYLDPSPDNDTISLAVDASGNTYLGTTIRIGGNNETRLRKFDSTGAIVWTRPEAEGEYSRLGALAVDTTGHLIVATMSQLSDVPESPMFVQKYSPAGQRLWETRIQGGWLEIRSIQALAVGPSNEITVLTMSDDDYETGEESGLTRIGPDGQFRFRITERQILVWSQSQLALDNFGNAYVTGSGARVGTGADAATAKYDAYGHRHWLVYYDGLQGGSQYGHAVGIDTAGDVRVLATEGTGSGESADFSVLHYRQRDPAGTFRLQLVADTGGTFHLAVTTEESFRIQASADLQNWDILSEEETQQLLQAGATSFADAPKRFFRLIFNE